MQSTKLYKIKQMQIVAAVLFCVLHLPSLYCAIQRTEQTRFKFPHKWLSRWEKAHTCVCIKNINRRVSATTSEQASTRLLLSSSTSTMAARTQYSDRRRAFLTQEMENADQRWSMPTPFSMHLFWVDTEMKGSHWFGEDPGGHSNRQQRACFIMGW